MCQLNCYADYASRLLGCPVPLARNTPAETILVWLRWLYKQMPLLKESAEERRAAAKLFVAERNAKSFLPLLLRERANLDARIKEYKDSVESAKREVESAKRDKR